jgi:creatinine deaminase
MKPLVTADAPPTDEMLNTIAHLPTKSLSKIVEDGFFQKLTDKDFTRIAILLALKSYEEGGCPIGGVFINNETRLIPGKGHNTLAQENHPYNLGETSAARDPGRLDFSRTTMLPASARATSARPSSIDHKQEGPAPAIKAIWAF